MIDAPARPFPIGNPWPDSNASDLRAPRIGFFVAAAARGLNIASAQPSNACAMRYGLLSQQQLSRFTRFEFCKLRHLSELVGLDTLDRHDKGCVAATLRFQCSGDTSVVTGSVLVCVLYAALVPP
jgi:hypothetical protein